MYSFRHLQTPEQGGAVADARVAGHRTSARATGQMPDHPVHGELFQHGIAVDAHQVFRSRSQGAHAQRIRLAKVAVQMDHPQAWVQGRKRVQAGAGVVAAAIVDGDHFEVRVALGQCRAEGVVQVRRFVVARDQQAGERILRHGRWIVARPRLPLTAEEVVQATGHPEERHHHGIEEGELEHGVEPRVHVHVTSPDTGNCARTSPRVHPGSTACRQ